MNAQPSDLASKRCSPLAPRRSLPLAAAVLLGTLAFVPDARAQTLKGTGPYAEHEFNPPVPHTGYPPSIQEFNPDQYPQPSDLEGAIDLVAGITDPDPDEQSRRRAALAQTLVRRRLWTPNQPAGKFFEKFGIETIAAYYDPQGQKLGDLSDRIDRWFKNSSDYNKDSETLGRDGWEVGVGQCDEHSILVRDILKGAGEDNVQRVSVFDPDNPDKNHAFTVVNLAEGADPNDPHTWGDDWFVYDSWNGYVFDGDRKTELIANSPWHYGWGWVGAEGDYQEEVVNKLAWLTHNVRGPLPAHLHDEYRRLVERYRKLPEVLRRSIEGERGYTIDLTLLDGTPTAPRETDGPLIDFGPRGKLGR